MAIFDLQGFMPPVLHHFPLFAAQSGPTIWPHLSFLPPIPPSRPPPLFLVSIFPGPTMGGCFSKPKAGKKDAIQTHVLKEI